MAKKPRDEQPEQTETPAVTQQDYDAAVEAMNALAVRMFEGQSDHVPMIERVKRIKDNLAAKGYEDILDQIVLPHPDYKRYL